MRSSRRVFLWVCGALAVLVGLAVGYYNFLLDWSARPICHKNVNLAFRTWMEDNGMDNQSQTNAFPNVDGKSADSLRTIPDTIGGFERLTDYGYVPGLREDDPGDLVLLYFKRPTRWTWHGPPPTIFKEKAWIVVPVDFGMAGRAASGPGELSKRVSFEEFRTRLNRTLDFVRTNERPNWQAIVAEHSTFLGPGE